MGPSVGTGVPGMELGMGMGMHGNGANQSQATEYTLQGVMRFLQSEWHRHERDRNAWDIERQEMRGRIANLASQVRRADATQKALRRYTSALEQRLRDQAPRFPSGPALDAALAAKNERAAKIQEKLQSAEDELGAQREDGVEGGEGGEGGAELRRHDLKTFLDQCQAEFMYLMASPANPRPPRDSPPLPMMEDLREADAFGLPGRAPEDRQYHLQRPAPHLQDYNAAHARAEGHLSAGSAPSTAPPSYASNSADFHPHLTGRSPRDQQPSVFVRPHDWSAPETMAGRMVGDSMGEPTFTAEAMSEMGDLAEVREQPLAGPEPDGWAFPEGAFPEPLHPQPPAPPPPTPPPQSGQLSSHRPDTDVFPNADPMPKSPKRIAIAGSHWRKGSMSRRRGAEQELSLSSEMQVDNGAFKLRFGLRGHLESVRSVIFSGGGSPGEPEICTAGDDGMIKRFNIPRLEHHPVAAAHALSDLDVVANFTHRGHSGSVLSLASWSPSPNFSTGGRAPGDGWIFSGGQDATVRVWERGRVDPKATLEGHTDAVWALCVLPATLGAVFGSSSPYGGADRILLVSGAADGSVRLWSVSAPPQLSSPQPGSNRSMSGRGGRVRGNSMSSGSGFPSSPQPTVASNSPFHYTLVHIISRFDGSKASPTCVSALGPAGETFVVSYTDAAVIVYDTASGEQVGQMDSMETFDGTIDTGVNAVIGTTIGLDQGSPHHGSSLGGEEEAGSSGPTGGRSMTGSGVEGTIISGHEDRFVRFFDANSGQCTYNMLAHPDAISSLSLSPDGRELVSAGHDASLRFWSLEKRACIQEITSHRIMRGEGVCSCIWSQDGKWVVSGGGDSVVKVYAR